MLKGFRGEGRLGKNGLWAGGYAPCDKSGYGKRALRSRGKPKYVFCFCGVAEVCSIFLFIA